MTKSLGIYIHIPFCKQKCHYCDFLSFAGCGEAEQQAYVEALTAEIRSAQIQGRVVDTVFVGGGTPSLLEPGLLEQVMAALRESFTIADEAEITIEANPGTLTEEKLYSYRNAGINRLSIGLQTTDDRLLAHIGRIHSFRQFLDNYQAARQAGFDNINVDLIFALEGQSLSAWEKTLDTVLALEPDHISFYSLQIEEDTPFYERFQAGQLVQAADETDRAMYHAAHRRFLQQGWSHYEISNAARPGRECRHNLKYWSMADYLGFGLGAHSFVSGVRFSNPRELAVYQLASGPDWIHKNDRKDSITDYMFTALRKTAGVSLEDFRRRFGQPLEEIYRAELAILVKDSLLCHDGESLCLTERGMDLANQVMAAFMEPHV